MMGSAQPTAQAPNSRQALLAKRGSAATMDQGWMSKVLSSCRFAFPRSITVIFFFFFCFSVNKVGTLSPKARLVAGTMRNKKKTRKAPRTLTCAEHMGSVACMLRTGGWGIVSSRIMIVSYLGLGVDNTRIAECLPRQRSLDLCWIFPSHQDLIFPKSDRDPRRTLASKVRIHGFVWV